MPECGFDRQLQGSEIRTADVRSGSGAHVRAGEKQSAARRWQPEARLRPLYLALLTFVSSNAVKLGDGLLVVRVNSDFAPE